MAEGAGNRRRDTAHGVVYQAVSGAPTPTFLVIGLNRSLGELDRDIAKAGERQKAVDAALGRCHLSPGTGLRRGC